MKINAISAYTTKQKATTNPLSFGQLKSTYYFSPKESQNKPYCSGELSINGDTYRWEYFIMQKADSPRRLGAIFFKDPEGKNIGLMDCSFTNDDLSQPNIPANGFFNKDSLPGKNKKVEAEFLRDAKTIILNAEKLSNYIPIAIDRGNMPPLTLTEDE